jgi:hypothetical protein
VLQQAPGGGCEWVPRVCSWYCSGVPCRGQEGGVGRGLSEERVDTWDVSATRLVELTGSSVTPPNIHHSSSIVPVIPVTRTSRAADGDSLHCPPSDLSEPKLPLVRIQVAQQKRHFRLQFKSSTVRSNSYKVTFLFHSIANTFCLHTARAAHHALQIEQRFSRHYKPAGSEAIRSSTYSVCCRLPRILELILLLQ